MYLKDQILLSKDIISQKLNVVISYKLKYTERLKQD